MLYIIDNTYFLTIDAFCNFIFLDIISVKALLLFIY